MSQSGLLFEIEHLRRESEQQYAHRQDLEDLSLTPLRRSKEKTLGQQKGARGSLEWRLEASSSSSVSENLYQKGSSTLLK